MHLAHRNRNLVEVSLVDIELNLNVTDESRRYKNVEGECALLHVSDSQASVFAQMSVLSKRQLLGMYRGDCSLGPGVNI